MTQAFSPRSLDEALALIQGAKEPVTLIAGGTDWMVGRSQDDASPRTLVSLLRIPELRGIRVTPDGIELGSLVSFTELRQHDGLAAEYPVLSEMAASIGGWQIQNRATLGGNVVNASPAGDSLPIWLALRAELSLASPTGLRTLTYEDFHRAYRRTALNPGEILVSIRVTRRTPGQVCRFRKVGTRAAQAISKVVVASSLIKTDGVLRNVTLAAGSVAPIPLRLRATEGLLEGQVPTVLLAERAAASAEGEISPIDDVRSTASYRRFALRNLIRRIVLESVSA